MQCINCEQPAIWLFKATGVADREYCNVHLPSAYRGTKNVRPIEKPAQQGVFDKPAPVSDAEAEAILEEAAVAKTVRKRRNKIVAEQIAAEEAAVEEAPVEESE